MVDKSRLGGVGGRYYLPSETGYAARFDVETDETDGGLNR